MEDLGGEVFFPEFLAARVDLQSQCFRLDIETQQKLSTVRAVRTEDSPASGVRRTLQMGEIFHTILLSNWLCALQISTQALS